MSSKATLQIYVSGDRMFPLTQDGRGEWRHGVPSPGIENAGFGFVSVRAHRLYICREAGTEFALTRCVAGKDGGLTADGSWPSGGDGPCYIAGDSTGQYFAVAHYSSGNVVVFRDGDTPEIVADLKNVGRGPHHRQEAAHSHCARFSPHNRFLYTCDLGTDEILVYPFDAAAGKVGSRRVAFQAPPGSGPRHIVFTANGEYAFVVSELANILTVFRTRADGTLTERQILSSVPGDFTGETFAAHLAADHQEKFLYVSNRGHDSIGVFAIGEGAELTPVQYAPSGGIWPWCFLITALQQMVVVNNRSDSVVMFDIRPDGTLAATGETRSVPRPRFVGALPT